MIADIRDFRQKLGLSQTELARKIGVTPNYLSSIECGRLKKTKRLEEKIERIFDCCENQVTDTKNPIVSLVKKTGLSREDIARKIGVTPNYLYMIESGRKPYSKKLNKLVDALFGLDPNESSPSVDPSVDQISQEVARLNEQINRLAHIIDTLKNLIERMGSDSATPQR